MTPRRTAEMEVIHAARQLVIRNGHFHLTPHEQELHDAVQLLDAAPLDPPTNTPTSAKAPQTAHDAAESMRKIVGKVAGDVFREFLTVHYQGGRGLTADAVQVRLKGTHQSISARVHDLAAKGWIEPTGYTQLTRSGRRATVYRPSPAGLKAALTIEEWSW